MSQMVKKLANQVKHYTLNVLNTLMLKSKGDNNPKVIYDVLDGKKVRINSENRSPKKRLSNVKTL